MTQFEFPDVICQADIEAFTSCPGSTPVVLWTLQHEAAVERLNRSGQLTGDPTHAFANAVPGKKLAYEWLRAMMAAKVSDYHEEWPVWALLNRPHSKLSRRPNDVLLRIEVPKSRTLVLFYEGWLRLLGVMHHLECCCGGIWPEQWILYQEPPYLDPIQHCTPTTDLGVAPVPKPWHFDEHECRKSWERIFDLTLYGREGFTWGEPPRTLLLQAVIPVLYLSDLGVRQVYSCPI